MTITANPFDTYGQYDYEAPEEDDYMTDCPQSGQLAPVFSHRGVPTITCSECDRRFLVPGWESVRRFPVHGPNDGDASTPRS